MQLVSNSVNLLQKHKSEGVENKDVLKVKAKDGHTDRQARMQITSLSAFFGWISENYFFIHMKVSVQFQFRYHAKAKFSLESCLILNMPIVPEYRNKDKTF